MVNSQLQLPLDSESDSQLSDSHNKWITKIWKNEKCMKLIKFKIIEIRNNVVIHE